MVDFQKASDEAIDPSTGELLNRPHIYSRFDTPRVSGLLCGKETYVQPQFAAECDISNILQKFSVSGILPEKPHFYGDISEIPDLQDVFAMREKIQTVFDGLPPDVREQFEDLSDFSEFVSTAPQAEVAEALGLSTSSHAGAESVTNQNSEANSAMPVNPVVKPETGPQQAFGDKAPEGAGKGA